MRRAAALAPLVALAVWAFTGPRGFFSGDSGVKLAQSHALWASGFTTRALPHDEAIDPDRAALPYGPFTRRVNGEDHGVYSIVFTAAVAPAVGLLGWTGTVVLPLLGGFLVFLGMRRLLRQVGVRGWLGAATPVFGLLVTPLGFYSTQLAEHSLAAGLTTVALSVLLERPGSRRAVLAGVLVALAGTVRPEGYCVAAAAGLALLTTGRLRAALVPGVAFGGATLAVLALYWGLNTWLSGIWDPLVALHRTGAPSWTGARLMVWGEVGGGPVALWFAPLLLASLAATMRRRRLALAAAAAALVAVAALAQSLETGRTLAGLFAVTPIAALGLLADPRDRRLRLLWVFSVLFMVQVLALEKSGTAGGLQFGARMLLPALPALLVLAAAVSCERWRRPQRGAAIATLLPAALLVILSGRAMVVGLPEVLAISRDGALAARRVAAVPGRHVITRRTWESQVVAPVLLEGKSIYWGGGDPVPLTTRLAERGEREFAFISNTGTTMFLPGRRVAESTEVWTEWLHVHHMVIRPRDP
jgi:hypothetical protein